MGYTKGLHLEEEEEEMENVEDVIPVSSDEGFESVRSNLTIHLSDTPFTIQQPTWRPRLLERVYKSICTLHWCGVL